MCPQSVAVMAENSHPPHPPGREHDRRGHRCTKSHIRAPISTLESRCTPSRALAAFVRCRDLTCRFPHCDKPATEADIDHTVPYPIGPTTRQT